MMLELRTTSGESVEAPLEQWIAALILELPPEVRSRLLERVQKGIVAYQTPGCHVLQVSSKWGTMPLQAFEAEKRERTLRGG